MGLFKDIESAINRLDEKLDFIDDTEAGQDFEDLEDKDIDNDGDSDESDEYLHHKLGVVAKMDEAKKDEKPPKPASTTAEEDPEPEKEVEDLYKKGFPVEELEEMSVTGGIDGGEGPPSTPYAFSDGSKEDEKRRKKKAVDSLPGYTVSESTYRKMMKHMFEVNESVSYREYKKDPNSTPAQKVNKGIAEVNKMLGEIEKIVHNSLRLKNEMGVSSDHFWKPTHARFRKISERLVRISNKLRDISQ